MNYWFEKLKTKAHARKDPDFLWALTKVSGPFLPLVVCSYDSCYNVCCYKNLNGSVFSFPSLIQTIMYATEEQLTVKEKTETSAVWNLILLYDTDSSNWRSSWFLFLHKPISLLFLWVAEWWDSKFNPLLPMAWALPSCPLSLGFERLEGTAILTASLSTTLGTLRRRTVTFSDLPLGLEANTGNREAKSACYRRGLVRPLGSPQHPSYPQPLSSHGMMMSSN